VKLKHVQLLGIFLIFTSFSSNVRNPRRNIKATEVKQIVQETYPNSNSLGEGEKHHSNVKSNLKSFIFSEKAYLEMDKIALEAGTDKSSAIHNYTKVYSHYFNSIKDKNFKFLEVGIYKGNSVKFWEKYFTKADLNFIDITSENLEYTSERSKYFYLDQSNKLQLTDFIKESGSNFDIIIEDGGHTMEQQLVSFAMLFPTVKSGGLYIVEDLHTSYWIEYGGSGDRVEPKSNKNSMTEFLKSLTDEVNFVGSKTNAADFDKISPELKSQLTYCQKNIQSIHFYDSLCFIFKR